MAITRQDWVNRTGNSPMGGIGTWNRLGTDCTNSAIAFFAGHNKRGEHYDPLVAMAAGLIRWDPDPQYEAAFGSTGTVPPQVVGDEVLIMLNPGNLSTSRNMFLIPIVTAVDTFGIPYIKASGRQWFSVGFWDSAGASAATITSIDFSFVVWGIPLTTTTSPFYWRTLAEADRAKPRHANVIGHYCEAESRAFLKRHKSDGTHNDTKIARGGAYFSQSAGSYTIKQQHGNISTALTDNGVGDLRINLSANMDSAAYVPVAQAVAAADGVFCWIDTIAAGSFDVNMVSSQNVATDGDLAVECFGNLA
ncbi:MAG: hypothetical protein ACE5EX_01825 [Phycisphaerae bacterium]